MPNSLVLTVNGGSSSIRFALFDAAGGLRRIVSGRIEGVGLAQGHFSIKDLVGTDSQSRPVAVADHSAAVNLLMDWARHRIEAGSLLAVGHRVVHGGPDYWEPQRITPEMIAALHQLSPFDPEHLPEEILLTEAFHRRFPDLPQVACFDTAFHHDLPRVARLLAIPLRYEAGACAATVSTACPAPTCWRRWSAPPGRRRPAAASSLPIWATGRA